ncbi:MAG: VWA domain-containing protein [Bacilli bacterium]|nr:VWA domain-containing protein [Bacilli bacterium]
MEIRYPAFIFIFIVLFIIVFFISRLKKEKKKNNIKIANTNIVKRTAYYKNILFRYRVLLYLIYGVLFLGIISSSVLSSRIVNRSIIKEEKYNRDIMLCLDVSSSTDQLNIEFIDEYIKLIDGLKGERIGISIFNSTSYLLAPLTEDYDYLKEVLTKMNKSLTCRNDLTCMFTTHDMYVTDGTLTDRSRGSSLIGDGLASCIFAFPKLDEKRTRSIILVTDNDVLGKELIDVTEASKLAKKKDITLYTIAPTFAFKKDISILQEAAKTTGGKSYIQTDDVSVIVNEINKKETSLLEGKKQEVEYDQPEVPFILLMISFVVLLFIDKELIR